MVSPAQAEAFLVSRYGGDVRDVGAVGQGEWSHALVFGRGDRDFIVRFSAMDEDFSKDRLAMRFAGPALPIPAVVETGKTDDGFYAISEHVPGGLLDGLDEAEMRATLPSLFTSLDAMREADLAGTTGYGIWGADGNAPHPNWRATLLAVANDRPGDRIHG